MMKLFILLALIAVGSARKIYNHDCDGIIVNGINHEKEVIKDYINKPYQLAIDYDTNVLYFSYTSNDDRVFSSAYFNLKTNESGRIDGVEGGFANAIDKQTHNVYFGGSNGIYKLNSQTKTATNLQVTNKNIWQLFSKDGIYFTTYPNEEAYLYKDGKVRKVPEIESKAMLLGVDNGYNIFFYNSSGLFYYGKNDSKTTHIGDYTVNGFTSDNNGKLYFSTPTGIYAINEKTKAVEMLTTIINIYGAAIESDDSIIYAAENSIVRLKSTGKECITELNVKTYIN